MRSSLCVFQGALSERLSRPAGNSFSERIAGSAAQIFENLVGREVEVVLTRFGLPPARVVSGSVIKHLIRQ
jgi:hypothetical protein